MSVFLLSARDQNKAIIAKTALVLQLSDCFSHAFDKLSHITDKTLTDASIKHVFIRENASAEPVCISSTDMKVQTAADLNCKYIEFELWSDRPIVQLKDNENCAFDRLMQANKRVQMPNKPTAPPLGKLIAPQKLTCDLIDMYTELGCGWTLDAIESGKSAIGKLTNALWYIDHCHKKFSDNACPVPKFFEKFQGYNNYSKLRHKVPIVTSEKLTEICYDLVKVLSFPSMSASRNKMLVSHIESLLKYLTKYRDRLNNDNKRQSEVYKQRDLPATTTEDVSCVFIEPIPKIIEKYYDINTEIERRGCYEFIDMDMFTPSDRIKRRNFIKDLRLSKPVMLYRVAYCGSLGTLNFIWRVPIDDSPLRSEKNSQVISDIMRTLPKFSTRAMRRDFIEKYSGYVKCPKSVLRNMFYDLTQTVPASESKEQITIDDRAAEVLLGSDDPDLLFDLRAMNGNESHFDVFYTEMGQFFEEQLLQVHERRHGNELYLPFAISIEDLRSQVKNRVPEGTPIPSSESIRLQFMPSSQFKKTALKYTGRFNVKFRVQTRMARVHHVDARYVATYMKYLKEFCVRFKEQCMFICLDDKAIVPVGEPGIPISTGVRGHNKVLAPSDGPRLVATDHDFHLCGIVPSVTLVTDIPEVACDSFFKGKIYVTTKDKVFQPSSPYRHSAELIRMLRQHYSVNDVDLQVPILCLMTDGGPDHRLTYETVKVCLVELFMHLDLDMLISIRTAPNNSWMNPAERCMSILNLALQHVALSRDKMDDAFENMIKHKSSLNAVRNLASIKPDLKPAFQTSIEKVIDIVNDRFSRMSLKEEKLTVSKGLDDDTVEGALNLVRVALSIPDEVPLTTTSKTKDIRKIKLIQDFIEKHGYSSHYCFQLMKCRNPDDACSYCLLCPVRNQTVFESLHFLPEPTPEQTGEHYKPFDQVYGNPPTIDAHRPSTKNTTMFDDADIEHDKLNREVFKAGKVRAAIKCGKCNKPRCVYCHSKTDREQDALLRRISEQNTYVCGEDIFTDEGLFMKLAVSCISEVEIAYYSGAA